MKLFFTILALLVTVIGYSVETRTTLLLKDVEWKVVNTSIATGEIKSINDFDEFDSNLRLQAEFLIDESEYRMAVLALNSLGNSFSVELNGESIVSALSSTNFHADITGVINDSKNTLQLIPKGKVSNKELKAWLEFAQINFLNNVSVLWVELREDAFFGGSMVEIAVQNFTKTDTDGKLVVSLQNPENWEEVAQNNNCAFSRGGSLINIEVNFPEAGDAIKGQELLVNVSLVDKEQNETVIDQLIIPVRF